ncbi:MAG: M20/M25/M40 family metallo-hydrolase [Solirubrobacterales bacterium]|nr:M20/M25/M40 family metallo-hydrolase [Solirubrobacterales bacterium]
MHRWVAESAVEIARRSERELEALVAISSPSGDRQGAEECASICALLVPEEAELVRLPCSSPSHAPDLVARLSGTGRRRILLLGHLDTVIPHADHRPLERDDGKLVGSGTVDMKGGVVLALGVLRALTGRRGDFAEATLLLVCDEEWRTAPFAHVDRFAGWDACLCFEAGERTAEGCEGVVVRRKAAGTVKVTARGRAAHSGSAPERGRNALLALAAAAQAVAARQDPDGPSRLTAVPTILRAGEAFNVVPDAGTLHCDVRADDLDAIRAVVQAVPGEVGGAALVTEMVRLWPGMDAEEATMPLLAGAGAALGRPVTGVRRGGASDASHFATAIAVTVDGLGPRGGLAHNPGEFVLAEALHQRAQVALAVTDAALRLPAD